MTFFTSLASSNRLPRKSYTVQSLYGSPGSPFFPGALYLTLGGGISLLSRMGASEYFLNFFSRFVFSGEFVEQEIHCL